MLKENAVKRSIGKKQLAELPFAVLCQLISAVCGFLLSRVMFFKGYAPLGIAAVAGMPCEMSIAAAIGAAIGKATCYNKYNKHPEECVNYTMSFLCKGAKHHKNNGKNKQKHHYGIIRKAENVHSHIAENGNYSDNRYGG